MSHDDQDNPPTGSSVEDSEYAIAGDNNILQHTENYYFSGPAPKSHLYEEVEITPENILALYDREKLHPKIFKRLTGKDFSSFLLIADHDDWVEGYIRRIKNECNQTGIPYTPVKISADDLRGAEVGIWNSVMGDFGSHSSWFEQPEQAQQDISTRIQSLLGQPLQVGRNKLVVCCDVECFDVHSNCGEMISKLNHGWKSILQCINQPQDNNDPVSVKVHLTVIYKIAVNPPSLVKKLLQGLMAVKENCHKRLYSQLKQYACECECLQLVEKGHTDQWREAVENHFPKATKNHSHWLSKVEIHIAKQFKRKHQKMPMRTLKDRVLDSNDDVDLFKYQLPRGK